MKYGFIGCGNMGGAIARALSKSTKDILLADYLTEKAAAMAEELGCKYAEDNESIVNNCDRIFLAVKPQMMAAVLKPLQPLLAEKKPLIITMAAGITIEKMVSLLGSPLPVIRIMPNTPVTVGAGMVLYCHNELVKESDVADLLMDAVHCGQWDYLEEQFIDAACVVSSCSPAYMYLFLHAMAEGAVQCGLPYEKGLTYAAATMIGAAKMVQQSDKTPVELANAVCSPGGSTLAGLQKLNEGNFHEVIKQCVNAAYNRNIELGK